MTTLIITAGFGWALGAIGAGEVYRALSTRPRPAVAAGVVFFWPFVMPGIGMVALGVAAAALWRRVWL